jgi:hypothetical protein
MIPGWKQWKGIGVTPCPRRQIDKANQGLGRHRSNRLCEVLQQCRTVLGKTLPEMVQPSIT